MMKFLVLFILLISYLLDCSKSISGGTETDTGQIKCWIVDRDDIPVDSALVLLRSADSIIDSTRTLSDGSFTFEDIPSGGYYIEVITGDSLGAFAKTEVQKDEVTSDTLTAREFGTIKGSIDKSLVMSDATMVYLVELDRTVPVDSAGVFTFDNVPEFNYTLQLVEDSIKVPSPLDSIEVKVTEKDTTAVYNIGSGSGSISVGGKVHE